MIIFNEENAKSKLKNKRILKQWIKEVVDDYGLVVGDLCYIFCTDDKILEVNRQYLSHDYYTDIITFDYVDGSVCSADMFISVDTVLSNSFLYSSSYLCEMHRVLIHGVLHLCGLKDKSPKDSIIMRAAEDKALLQLKLLLEQ
ncbi:MAG: rRNA maturation RNase YbeY [Marinilabiliaceae bacterium]|nr:rRNA maturation RNase YbeY [Marinilabiliaceae bacterium]